MSNPALAAIVRAVVTAAVFALAFWGFLQAYPPGADGRSAAEYFELAYRSVQLCVGEFPDDLRGHDLPVLLQVSRFLVPLVTAWATLSLAWGRVRNQVRLRLMRSRGGHVVVAGEGELARRLVIGERRRKGGLAFWADRRGPMTDEVEQQGGAFVPGRRSGEGADMLGLSSARAFVAAGDSDPENLDAAKRAMDEALTCREAGEPLQLIARVDDSELHAALEGRFNAHEARRKLHLRLASMPRLVARRMFLEHPIDRFQTGDERLRVCWVGWSPEAERMLERLLVAIHLRGGRRPEYVVLDPDAARIERAFRERRPGAEAIAEVRFVALDGTASADVTREVVRAAGNSAFNAVYITLPDSARCLTAGLALETRLEKDGQIAPPIYVFQPDGSGGASAGFVTASALIPFGAVAQLGDLEALLQEEQDEIARSIHEFYLEGRLADGEQMGVRQSMAEWDELPESVRDENRLVADCYQVKLRDIGARIVDGDGAQLRFTPDEVESLARAEHDRWMAAKLLDGWTHGAARDDAARRHPDIIPYDALSEPIKDLDREQVAVIPRILAASKRRAVRDYVLMLEAGAAPGPAAAAQVQRALQALAASHPDRAVVLMGDPAVAAVAEAMVAASDKGSPLAFILREPVVPTLDRLASADRDRLAAALRRADRMFACPKAEWSTDRLAALVRAQADGLMRLDGVSEPQPTARSVAAA